MNALPNELVEACGLFLDGPSLVSSLQVCRLWHNLLEPLVYHSITRTNWHHRSFPIQQRGNVYAHHRQKSGVFHIPALEQYRPQLRAVQDIEWICNVYLQERDRKLVPQSFKPRKELSTFRLRSILQWCPNLQSLTLHQEKYHVDPALLQQMLQLTSLRRLDISVNLYRVQIETLFPLFSRLEELKLSGPWFRIDVDKHKHALQPSEEPWKIRKLTVTENFLPLLRYCPNLKELERILRYGYDWRSTRTINSIIWIKACPMLERLKLCKWIPDEFQSADMVATLCTLRYLKTLIYQVHRVEDVAFLCSAADTTAETRVLPLLKHFDIDINPYARFQTNVMIQECYATILRNRPELKSFILRGQRIDARLLFTPKLQWEVGQGHHQLETLSLTLRCTLRYTTTEEDLCQQWSVVYGCLGRLPKLRSLSIFCKGLEHGQHSGIEQLANGGNLQTLTLLDDRYLTWSRDDIPRVLSVSPKLGYLSLMVANAGQVKAWLQESGRKVDLKLLTR